MLFTSIFANVLAYPASKDFKTKPNSQKIPVLTYNITGNIGQKSIILFKACNFSQINPDFRITSDLEIGMLFKLTDGRSYNNSCTKDMMVMVKAKESKSIQIKIEPRDKAGDEPRIIIKTISPTKIPDRFQVVFKICAAKMALQNPTIQIQSDQSEDYVSVVSRIGIGTCVVKDTMVFAKDPKTIKIEILTNKKSETQSIIAKKTMPT